MRTDRPGMARAIGAITEHYVSGHEKREAVVAACSALAAEAPVSEKEMTWVEAAVDVIYAGHDPRMARPGPPSGGSFRGGAR